MSINEIKPEKDNLVVKFYFTNQKLLPVGINLKPRMEARIETKHWTEGKKLGIPEGGLNAERPDRVDTGKSQKFTNVDLVTFWQQLMSKYTPTDAHYFYQEQSVGMKKPVIVITFSANGKEDQRIKRLMDQIWATFVRDSTWGTVQYWENPPGKPDTFNCMHRQPRQQTLQQSAIKNST